MLALSGGGFKCQFCRIIPGQFVLSGDIDDRHCLFLRQFSRQIAVSGIRSGQQPLYVFFIGQINDRWCKISNSIGVSNDKLG